MRWGKRHYHRESYFTRQHAKYKRRLRKQLIPGYGRHRKGSIKQWQNRVHERYYRQHTYPSYSERLRMWGEGYNPHPRRRTYTSSRRKTSRRRPSTTSDDDDDNDDGCVGCGCLSFILAVFIGASVSSYSVFFVIFFFCIFCYLVGLRLTRNLPKHKPKAQPQATSSSEANPHMNSLQASTRPSSASFDVARAQSLGDSTMDSLQSIMDSVVAKSDEGYGFDSYSLHHSIHRAESSMKSILPSGNAHRAYALNELSGMYSNVTKAGREFSSSASDNATVSINISVNGNPDNLSSSQSSASNSYTSNHQDKD